MRRVGDRSYTWSFSFVLLIVLLLFASPARGQTSAPSVLQSPGIVNGTVVDETGTAIAGARVSLTHAGTSAGIDVLSSEDGRFSYPTVPAGPFSLTVSSPEFANRTVSGGLEPGTVLNLPPVRLTLTLGNIDVDVTVTRVQVAEQQLKEQTQQRLLGVLPNFRVSYR